MFVPVSMATKNDTLRKFCDVPLIGGFLMLGVGFFIPVLIAAAFTNGSPQAQQNSDTALLLGGVAVTTWNVYLTTRGTYVKMAWIPAWVWGVLFIMAGIAGSGQTARLH